MQRDGKLVATLDRGNPRAKLPPGEYELEAISIDGYEATEFQVETMRLHSASDAERAVSVARAARASRIFRSTSSMEDRARMSRRQLPTQRARSRFRPSICPATRSLSWGSPKRSRWRRRFAAATS